MEAEQIKKLFELYPILSSIPGDDLGQALKHSKVITLKAGSIVFEELQSCHAFPFVLSGDLRVIKRSENGREISLYSVSPGDACVVTSACLLGNKPYNAVGHVQSDCELVTRAMETAWVMYERLGFQRFREIDFRQGDLEVLGFQLSLNSEGSRPQAIGIG